MDHTLVVQKAMSVIALSMKKRMRNPIANAGTASNKLSGVNVNAGRNKRGQDILPAGHLGRVCPDHEPVQAWSNRARLA